MKIFKKLMCAAVAVVLTMSFAGCGENGSEGGDDGKPPVVQTQKLATPQNVTVSDEGLISWNAVENAQYYVVVLNGVNYTAGSTSYQVGSVVNDFTYAVYAAAEGYENSDSTETKTFKGKGIPVVIDPLIENLTVSLTGRQLVGSGRETLLTATVNFPDGNTNKNVSWSVEDGAEYVESFENGLFKAKEVTEDHDVTVRATSLDNEKKYAELVICVASQPELTDDMVNGIKDDYISFEGYMDIDLYNFGIVDDYVRTVTLSGVATHMNGERWHASYVDSNSGYVNEINYLNRDGKSNQVALSLMNDEQYFPMTDERGETVSWTDAGLYNNFKGVSVSDFTFNEDTWRYRYNGSGDTMQKIVSSATPYEFEVDYLELIIEEGELLGIYAESKPSFTTVEKYKAVEKLYGYINCGADNVKVPEIVKFERNPATTDGGHIDHDALGAAIENMQKLKSYTLDMTISSHMASGYTVNGFVETVTDGDYYFQPYDVNVNTMISIPREGAEYGYHRVDENTYNSYNYDSETDKFVAARAFSGDMSGAKASFGFAPEIFTAYQSATFNNKPATVYYVDESMCHAASTFYFGVGNDVALYGQFAMRYEGLANYTPVVVVQDGYIVQTGFFYFLGDMYGEVLINYTDFDSATLPEGVSFEGFVPRTPPAGWGDLSVIDQTVGGNDEEKNALEFFTAMLGEDVGNLPFFNETFGDTFAFALATHRAPGGSQIQVPTVILYYDVPLGEDRTIDRSIKQAQEFLVNNGFTKNQYGEYVKGNVSVLPYDSSLDLWIYVWKTV